MKVYISIPMCGSVVEEALRGVRLPVDVLVRIDRVLGGCDVDDVVSYVADNCRVLYSHQTRAVLTAVAECGREVLEGLEDLVYRCGGDLVYI